MTMNTPAIRNQYGEMITGMPKGRPITSPEPGFAGGGPGLPGVMPATSPMLRARPGPATAEMLDRPAEQAPHRRHAAHPVPAASQPRNHGRVSVASPRLGPVDEIVAVEIADPAPP